MQPVLLTDIIHQNPCEDMVVVFDFLFQYCLFYLNTGNRCLIFDSLGTNAIPVMPHVEGMKILISPTFWGVLQGAIWF